MAPSNQVVYISKVRIERERGPMRRAYLPAESEPVDLFFVLLSPPGREGEHIKLLARICRLAQHAEDLDEVRGATDTRSLLDTILRLDSRHV